MTITLQASDALEYFHDTDYEILGNQGTYGVVSGCAVSYDASDLTVDIAVGAILHNGTVVTVAAQANALTLVADSSNKRWAYIALDSSGTAALVSGDAAADSSTEPTKPELGDNVLLAMVKIEAAQTVANDIAVKLDKRLMLRGPFTVIKSANETVNSSTTTQNDDELTFPGDASTTYAIDAFIKYNSGTTPDFKFEIAGPSGATADYTAARMSTSWTVTTATEGVAYAADGSGADAILLITGVVYVSTTAGAVVFKWAQNTSDAGDTTVAAGSWLRWTAN